MKTTTSLPNDRYPRSLFLWTKTEDKALLNAIKDGQSVLEVSEDLGREHISVLRRISDLDLFQFEEFTEEWVEMMGLALAGVPLQVVINWCSASTDRLPLEDIEAMAMGDLRPEFELACQHRITVACSDAVVDLSWLATQPIGVQAGYLAACNAIRDEFDVVTPLTLKNKVLGIVPPALVRTWPARSSSVKAPPASKRRSGVKRYRRKSSAKSPSFRTYGEKAGRSKTRASRKSW